MHTPAHTSTQLFFNPQQGEVRRSRADPKDTTSEDSLLANDAWISFMVIKRKKEVFIHYHVPDLTLRYLRYMSLSGGKEGSWMLVKTQGSEWKSGMVSPPIRSWPMISTPSLSLLCPLCVDCQSIVTSNRKTTLHISLLRDTED